MVEEEVISRLRGKAFKVILITPHPFPFHLNMQRVQHNISSDAVYT
jgi:hypothetical protein